MIAGQFQKVISRRAKPLRRLPYVRLPRRLVSRSQRQFVGWVKFTFAIDVSILSS